MNIDALTPLDLVQEFNHTRPRHGGVVDFAAPILGMSTAALEMAPRRARKSGIPVTYTWAGPA